MKPRTPEVTPQHDLFRSRLENLVSLRQPLVRPAERMGWDALNECLGAYYEDAAVGQPPKPTRLMAAFLCLKHTYSLSDEARALRWLENPYWQAFCVGDYFQHEPPIHPTSLPRYRKRLEPTGSEGFLRLTLAAGIAQSMFQRTVPDQNPERLRHAN